MYLKAHNLFGKRRLVHAMPKHAMEQQNMDREVYNTYMDISYENINLLNICSIAIHEDERS